MSAYLCDADHISALINAAQDADIRDVSRYLRPETRAALGDVYSSSEDALFADLLQENLDSLAYRYPDATRISDWTSAEGEYRYNWQARYLTPIAAIKGAHCYDYQSCEHPAWELSLAKRFVDCLISGLIHKVPGYEAAEWGYASLVEQRARAS